MGGVKSLTLAVARFVYCLRPFLPAHPNDFAIFQKLATTINEFFHMYMQISPGEPSMSCRPSLAFGIDPDNSNWAGVSGSGG